MHEENFEAPFDEQMETIQAFREDGLADLDHLPSALNDVTEFTPYCFKWPDAEIPADTPYQILTQLAWMPESQKRAARIMSDYTDEDQLKASLLRGLNDAGQEAVARILAILVCAEESAINIFHHECKRIEENQIRANRQALLEIESEERVHNWLIHKARSFFQTPDDIPAIRRRTRRLFMRVGSRQLDVHFARISGLDSGVCICLTALLGSSKVTDVEGFARLIRHIRLDESSHVKKARTHAADLGFQSSQFGDAYDLVRTGMVGMLEPISSSFETLGVDPDRLFKRLLRFQTSRD